MGWNKNTDIEKIREYNRQYYQRKLKEKRAKERQEKGQEVRTKECPICHSTFTTDKPNQKYCCDACKKLSHRIKGMLYRQTKEYKERTQSEEFKEKVKQKRQTEKYKEYRKQYAKTDTYKKAMKKYAQSEKGKATLQRYIEKRKANGWKPLGETEEE